MNLFMVYRVLRKTNRDTVIVMLSNLDAFGAADGDRCAPVYRSRSDLYFYILSIIERWRVQYQGALTLCARWRPLLDLPAMALSGVSVELGDVPDAYRSVLTLPVHSLPHHHSLIGLPDPGHHRENRSGPVRSSLVQTPFTVSMIPRPEEEYTQRLKLL
ncbi:hypothetical protein COCON_G00141090 [Conger conger]|uniref:Uncharacterized protein n=1 Tax=Conger conger TaxID=82655 RepID=A0A9Q1HVL4_CONCO|nr:hypothetical protein COCON_G00141090 [Conger conger]